MLDDPQRFPIGYVVARTGEGVDWSQVTETIDGVKHRNISVFFESFERGSAVGLAKIVEKQRREYDELRYRLNTLEALLSEKAQTKLSAAFTKMTPLLAVVCIFGFMALNRGRKGRGR